MICNHLQKFQTEEKIDNADKYNPGCENEATETTTKRKARQYRWRKKEPRVVDTEFKGAGFSKREHYVEETSPLSYFKLFWDDNMVENLVEQTNLYSVQQEGKV